MRICRDCRTPLPSEATDSVCPACQGRVPTSPTALAPVAAPPRSEIAACFPQLEILDLLGFGGMGLVYKARQPQLDRVVALKILSPELARDPAFAERFAREAKALAKLNHPNIVGVYDFGRAGDFYYFLMEYVDGVNLHTLIQDKQIKPDEAVRIIVEICNALQFAHDEGIIHRDIKPANVLIDKKGRVKIADFGLARLGGADTQKTSHATQTKMILGTPHYMAPEQVERPLEVDHRADLYSLGVVFYEMLTGELPIGRFPLPSEKARVDARLDDIVLRALEKEPSRRYQQAKQIRSAVESLSMDANLQRLMGFEYRSKAALFGLPLLHVAYGFDPATGKKRVARGVVAIGTIARGFLALGGMATGIFAFGGISFGLVAAGLAGFGLISFGVMALGLLFSYGGLAGAPVAIGGAAFGYYAHGGVALGTHVLSHAKNDQITEDFFKRFAQNPLLWAALGLSFFPAMIAAVVPLFTPHKESRKSIFLHQLGLMAGAALVAVMFYLFINSQLSPDKMSPLPQNIEAFIRDPEGPAMTKPLINHLNLKSDQIQQVNKIIRENEQKFVALERQHSESSTDTNGHIHLIIAPFPDEVKNLMDQMWTDLAGVLDKNQIAKAHTVRFAEKLFPHTGQRGMSVVLWNENGEDHFEIETPDPANKGPRKGRALARGLPPRWQTYLQKDKPAEQLPATNR